jgi:protein-tyrosine phosphatase
MVVEQLESPGVIVMLTETHEANMEKCYQYFPRRKEDPPLEVGGRDEFGEGFYATVHCEGLEDTPAGDAIELRKLIVRVHKAKRRNSKPLQNGEDGEDEHDARRQAIDQDRATPARLTTTTHGHDVLETLKSPTADIRQTLSHLPSSLEPEPSSPTRSASATPISSIPQSPVGEEDEVEERIIYHFLYKKWPDFGVPALEDIDSFFTLMRLSREKNASPSNPRVVHCSAGVGRSGTFIALEHLMRELDSGVLENWDDTHPHPPANKPTVDDAEALPDAQDAADEAEAGEEEEETDDLIFNTVNSLREQRKTMVQSEAQYLFIYQVMRKLWLDRYGSGREGTGEPAKKRLEVGPDPFVEKGQAVA